MKKLPLIILTVIVLGFVLNGCKPSGMSSQAYKFGKQTLDIVDSYFDAEISREEGYDEIAEVHEKIEQLYDIDDNVQTLFVEISVSALEFDFQVNTDADILKNRNELAEKLNVKKIDMPSLTKDTRSDEDKEALADSLELPGYKVTNKTEALYGKGFYADVTLDGVSKSTKATKLIQAMVQISVLEGLYEASYYCKDGLIGVYNDDDGIEWASGWGY